MSENTWLIAGASSGLDYGLARHVLEQGDRVVMGRQNRRPYERTRQPIPRPRPRCRARCDRSVTSEVCCSSLPRSLWLSGRAGEQRGYRLLGAIEEQDEADYRATFEVNFFGAVELIRLALPGMRSPQRGTIVNISSLRGIVSSEGNGYYSSSKFALEGLTEALWQEIEPLGLRAFLVEPGPFRTGLDTRTRFSGSVIDAYEGSSGRILKIMANIKPEQFPGDPTRAATAIYQEVRANSKRHRMILGSEAYRLIGARLNAFQSELEFTKDLAFSTDYPDAGPGVL